MFTIDALMRFIEHGRAWVATEDGAVVGVLVTGVVDGCAHIDEIAVARSGGRRGHGAALIGAVQRWPQIIIFRR